MPGGGVVLLDGTHDIPAASGGGKAATLARLRRLGHPCLPGVVVGSQIYRTMIEQALVAGVINDESGGLPPHAAARLEHYLRSCPLDGRLLEDIVTGAKQVGAAPPWIVRSSAVGEDGLNASFAGQFSSVGPVAPESLADALRQIWASGWTYSAWAYRTHRGLAAATDVPLAVLVQPYVEPEIHGVGFISGDGTAAEVLRVECLSARALGAPPDVAETVRYVFDPRGHAALAPEAEIALPDALIDRLWVLGTRLVDDLGGDQDFEWLVSGGEVLLVQARPVTVPVP